MPTEDRAAAASDERLSRIEARVSALESVLQRRFGLARADQPGERPQPLAAVDATETREPEAPRGNDSSPQPAADAKLDFERLLGGRFYLAIGAIVVVIGVGLFLKLGYDAGWFRLGPMWKCIWGATFGLLLVAAGEIARRRINAIASAGLAAAGIGAIYASAFAAHGLYSLVDAPVALLLLAATSALGILASVRIGVLLVAVLSLVGAYAAPFILTVREPEPIVLPVYLFALLVLGLALSGWRPRPFSVLRSIVWSATVLLGTVWLLWQGLNRPYLSLPFLALVWGAQHLELMVGAQAWLSAQAADDDEVWVPATPWRLVRPVAISFATTGWVVGMAVMVLREQAALPDWLAPAAGTCVTLALSLVLATNLRWLTDVPRTDGERLGAGLTMQAGGLLIGAVALALQGWMEVVGWLGMGVAVAGGAAWIRSQALTGYGLVVLTIGAVRLVVYDSWATWTPGGGAHVFGLVLDRWSLLMLLGAGAWFGAVRLLLVWTGDPLILRLARAACGVGAVLVYGSLIRAGAEPSWISGAWLAIGAAAGLGSPLAGRLGVDRLGLLGLGASIVAWLVAYRPEHWSQQATSAVFHPGFPLALAIAGGLALWARRYRGAAGVSLHLARLAVGIAGALTLATTTLEVRRITEEIATDPLARAAAISIWWGIFGLALLLAGVLRRVAPARCRSPVDGRSNFEGGPRRLRRCPRGVAGRQRPGARSAHARGCGGLCSGRVARRRGAPSAQLTLTKGGRRR